MTAVNIILDSEYKARMRELVDRLRSAHKTGEFVPTREQLRDEGNGRCCLGVECEIFAEKFGGEWDEMRYDDHMILAFQAAPGDNREGHYMPRAVARYLMGNPELNDIPLSWETRLSESVKASHLNDWRFTFDQIADCLEWEYLS
jgi:hypothetical protein